MPRLPQSPSRRRFVQGSAVAAIAPFFIGRSARAADDPEFTMKIATAAPDGTPWMNQMKGLKTLMWEGSNKRLKVKPYPGATLGSEPDTVDGVKRGAIQCYGGSVSALASAVPEVACLELPYLFKTEKKADKVIDGVFADLDALLWDRGFKLFFFSENGFRSIGSTFPINSLADLKGRKMRSQESEEHLDTWKAFGASPVPIAVTEVLPALQTGVVDGFDNTPLFAFAASWYQGISHFTLTEHIYQPGIVVLSRKWYETLPAEIQALFTGKLPAGPAGTKGSPDADEPGADGHGFVSQQELSKAGRRGVRAIKGQLLKNFEVSGIKVHHLSDSEKAAFSASAAIAHAQFIGRASAEGKALFKKITTAM